MDIPPPPAAIVVEHQNPVPSTNWAKDAIWYQVFPERFRNGAPQSDPRPEDFGGEHIQGWRVSPWSMEWYARDDWEKPGAEHFFDTVYDRRFGGDLIGIRDELPYLQRLGVNAIYLNPVFMAATQHKYDASCYHHIDPSFGPDREGDLRALAAADETEDPATWIWTKADRYFLDLVADIHARGMHVIIDGVFNHSGTRCFAFQDLKENGRNSKYVDWYHVKAWHDDGTFDYASWDGGGSLPSYGRNDDTLNPGIRKYIFDCTRRWMDPSGQGRPSEGVDGWRLDVPFCVPQGFWREWQSLVRAINPAAYTSGEIPSPAQDWVTPDLFDAVMNYEWTYPTISFFTPGAEAITATEFRARIDTLHARHPWDSTLVLQNLLDSHDTGRVLTMFESRCPSFRKWGPYFNWPKVADNPALVTSKPREEAKDALRLTAVWQMTGPGAPMIYYGDEVGMWGANDPCDRQPMLWNDIPADPETRGFRAPLDASNARAPDMGLFAFYQRLISMRTAEPALRRGTFRWLESPDDATLVFEREHEGTTIWCAIHKGGEAVEAELPRPGQDLWTSENVPAGKTGIPSRGFRVIRVGAP